MACSSEPGSGWANGAARREQREPEVVATVNGVPITRADLAYAMTTAARANPHEPGASASSPPVPRAVLDSLINDELAAQRAVARGLATDPTYQEELGRLEAQLDAFRRQRLARLLFRDVADHAEVTDAEARSFFDERADRIRTTTHIWQILSVDPLAIENAQREIAGGAAFADVALRTLGARPTDATPWDLGYLKWNQIPEPWETVLPSLAIGETSSVIEGPGRRRWIIRVVDRQVDPGITFDHTRPAIVQRLQARAATDAQTALERALRVEAKIEIRLAPSE